MRASVGLVVSCVGWAPVSQIAAAPQAEPTVRITEFLARNDTGLQAPDGTTPDWIELHNPTERVVELEGWYLTDDPYRPRRWRFPACSMPPNDYLVIFASGEDGVDADGGLHTDFRLGGDGEYLALIRPDGKTVVSEFGSALADYPPQYDDVSFGIATGAAVASASERPAVPDGLPRPLAYWPFDALTASRSPDVVGGSDALLVGAELSDAGRFGSALQLRGDGGFATAGVVPELVAPDAVTISLWFRRRSDRSGRERDTNHSINNVLVAHSSHAWNDNFEIGTEGGTVELYLDSEGTARGERNLRRRASVVDGAWYHLALTYDGARQALGLYIDGERIARSSDWRGPLDESDASPLTFGVASIDHERWGAFDGQIDDVAVWTQALTAEQVAALADGALPVRSAGSRSKHGGAAAPHDDGDVGGGSALYFPEPTPGRANAAGVRGFVAAVELDRPRGFYDQPFTLSLRSRTPGVRIYATTDGSRPGEENGTLVHGEVAIDTTTVLRAAAFKDGYAPSAVTTRTFLFLDDVLRQPSDPPGFPDTWVHQPADYAMDARVVDDPRYSGLARDALRSHPTISIAIDVEDFLGAESGNYTHSLGKGSFWERPVSVELFDFPHGDELQIDAGLRMQGNVSRRFDRPKHNMRLCFRGRYGSGKLRFRLYEGTAARAFDNVILRGQNGDAWISPNATQRMRAQYIRDQWHRDAQAAMGMTTINQGHAHVYVNGLYWGFYHVYDRVDPVFFSENFGGDEGDYDVVQDFARTAGRVEATAGDLDAWNAMMAFAEGDIADPAVFAKVTELLDVERFVDYMLLNFYSGNTDWDVSNWRAGRRREEGAGFLFFPWDSERTFGETRSRTVVPDKDVTGKDVANRASGLHQLLTRNAEYRMFFADRVQKHFFADGVLTPAKAEALWMRRVDELRLPLIAESARWGDAHRPERPYGPDDEWSAEVARLREEFFPVRTGIVLGQLRRRGLYPDIAAPSEEEPESAHDADLVWRAADSPIRVERELVVPWGSSLTIEPGVTVEFDAGAALVVRGRLTARGTPEQRIEMGVRQGQRSWGGIHFEHSRARSELHHVDISSACERGRAVFVEHSSARLHDVRWSDTKCTAIRVLEPDLVVSDCRFPDTGRAEVIFGAGIDPTGELVVRGCEFAATSGKDIIDLQGGAASGRLFQAIDNTFLGGQDDGIDLDGTDGLLEGNRFMNFHVGPRNSSTANAVSLDDGSVVWLVRNVFRDNDHAVLAKGRASVRAEHNTIVGSRIAAIQLREAGRQMPRGRLSGEGNLFWANERVLHGAPEDGSARLDRSLLPVRLLEIGRDNVVASAPFVSYPDDLRLAEGSPARGSGPSGLDIGADVPPGAAIRGIAPTGTSGPRIELRIGGPGITHYRARLDQGEWSAVSAVDQPLRRIGLEPGEHRVSVQGRNRAGVWQAEPTAVDWTVVR